MNQAQQRMPWLHNHIRLMLPLAAGIIGLLAVPVLTQEEFHPESVRPKGCEPGQYNCGMNPLPASRHASIPLADSTQISHRGLPSSADFSSKMPPVDSQGQQSSCVAWSSTYAAKSYLEQVERGWGYDAPVRGGRGSKLFSPAYVYNQINGGKDNGSYISDALDLLVQQGAATWQTMPYTARDYRAQPNTTARREAASYKNRSYRRIGASQISALRSELANGNPIVFGMAIDDAFYNYKGGVYAKQGGRNYGGHAMTLVGYDDNKVASNGERGAFKIINSWGTSWGESGYAWISYRLWNQLNPYAYVVYDQQNSTTTTTDTTDTSDTTDVEEPQVVDEEEDSPTPAPPGNVTASQGTYSDKVVLNWAGVHGAIAYAVGRAPSTNPDDFDYLGYSTSTSYTDSRVQPGFAYRYVVITINAQRETSDPEKSKIVEGYAAAGQTTQSEPDQVTGLDASLSSNGGRPVVEISWSEVDGATQYYVYRGDSNSKGVRRIATSRSDRYIDRSPKANATNYYYVAAVNSVGTGPNSDSASVNVAGSTTKPGQPSGLTATQGSFRSKIELNWSSVPGAEYYVIYRYNFDSKRWEGPKKASSTSFTDDHSTVASGKWFAYAVAAANGAGMGPYSRYANGRTNPNATRGGTPIDPPKKVDLKVNPQSQIVTLTWSAVKGASQYNIFRAVKKGQMEFIKNVSASSRTFSEKLPSKGEIYYYAVRSQSAMGGESVDSEENIKAAFINVPKTIVSHRAMPGQGFDQFAGSWTGQVYEGKAPVQYTVSISGQMGQWQADISKGGRKIKTVKGSFAANARSLNARQFRMELGDLDDMASANLSIGSENISVGLSRTR
ncbi:MAG: hypothetical protein KDK39_05070 [Leptospiraceae bacterium]|nr:hypothetical protein [Leptospiraceae bacterium]